MSTVTIGNKLEKYVIDMLAKNKIKAVRAPPIMKGIDGLIIKNKYETYPMQIKSRKYPEYGHYIGPIHKFYKNFFIIAISYKSKLFWIIPGNVFRKLSFKNKNTGYRIRPATKDIKDELEKYKGKNGIIFLRKQLQKKK